jgi:hypothetical protein
MKFFKINKYVPSKGHVLITQEVELSVGDELQKKTVFLLNLQKVIAVGPEVDPMFTVGSTVHIDAIKTIQLMDSDSSATVILDPNEKTEDGRVVGYTVIPEYYIKGLVADYNEVTLEENQENV